jgi:large-conductance mechanosensitive channel
MAEKKNAASVSKSNTTSATAKATSEQASQAKPLASKTDAELKREVQARLKHMGPLASAEVMNDALNKQVSGFIDFLREQSVVGLAIGLVLGTQIKQLVDQLITSFFNPLIGLLLPGKGTLAEKTFTLHIGPKSGTFGWGAFAATLISFIFVAAVVYYVFKGLKLDKLTKKKS